jgi:hypothetical protein
MSGNWLHNIKHVNAGEPVQAGVVSRPDRTLENRTEYLKDRLDAAALGRALFDTDATIAPDVLAGQPVYWNYTEKRYELAIAAVAVDNTTQALNVQPSSDCVGLCLRKKSDTQGDVVLRGIVEVPDLGNAINGNIQPGRYYLSSAEPGKLVKQKPAVSVAVCHVQGPKDSCSVVPRVLVMPHIRDFIDEHVHYRFDLVARPAGTHTPPSGNGIHTINPANAALPGWLPANNAIFNGKAPAGALFGYNLSQHTALANVWPPLPIQSVAVLWDKGSSRVGATEVPLGSQGLVVCDTNGIWWMSNCYGDVPWPATLNTNTVVNPTTPPVEECPRDETMRVSVVFLRMLLGNDRSAVTSLEPDIDESPIVVTNCDGAPATTGDLRLDLNMQVTPGDSIGGRAVKEIVSGKKLKTGGVAEGAFTLSNQLRITGTKVTPTRTVTLTVAAPAVFTVSNHGFVAGSALRFTTTGALPTGLVADTTYFVISTGLTTNTFQVSATLNGTAVATSGSQAGVHSVDYVRLLTTQEKSAFDVSGQIELKQGVLRIEYTDQFVERELQPQIIRLSDTVERLYTDIPYIGFPAGQASLIRLRFNVPYSNMGDNLAMKVRVQYFGRGAGTMPALYLTRRILPAPAGNAQQQLITVDQNMSGLLAVGNMTADMVIQRDSDPFVVAEGNTVLITLGRTENSSDVYGEVGVLRVTGIVYSTT